MGQSMPVGKRTVLVVDDEAFIRIFLVDLIEDHGFVVLEASDADEAIALMEQHPEIDVVVTDIQMPGSMDGLKLSHYIRDRWPPTTLIVTSGKAALDQSSLPTDASFLSKPIDTKRLMRTIGVSH